MTGTLYKITVYNNGQFDEEITRSFETDEDAEAHAKTYASHTNMVFWERLERGAWGTLKAYLSNTRNDFTTGTFLFLMFCILVSSVVNGIQWQDFALGAGFAVIAVLDFRTWIKGERETNAEPKARASKGDE